jgi:hypothetical protein
MTFRCSFPQEAQLCKDAGKYEGPHFVPDWQPLVVARVRGRIVVEVNRKKLPQATPEGLCLSLFTADTHEFVSATTVDVRGHFDFGPVTPGNYRLLARADGFCTGNSRVQVKGAGAGRKRKSLIVYFRPAALDVCTTAGYDRK